MQSQKVDFSSQEFDTESQVKIEQNQGFMKLILGYRKIYTEGTYQVGDAQGKGDNWQEMPQSKGKCQKIALPQNKKIL